MLFEFCNLNKYGIKRKRIIYNSSSSIGIKPKNLGNHVFISMFKYDYEHSYIPPVLYVNNKGDKMLNNFTKVHPQTTLNDINWIRPKIKIEKVETFEFKSSSSNEIYIVRKVDNKLSCSCKGYWRAKDRNKGCKHIQEINKL